MYSAIKDDNIANLKNSARDLKNTTENAANDISNSAKDLAYDAKNAAQDIAGEAKSELRDAAKNVGTQVRSLLQVASDDITKATDSLANEIKSNPVQSSAIALGVGFILGALFRR